MWHCSFFPFICFWMILGANCAPNNTEKIALKSLYDATGGEYWDWDLSKPIWNFTDPDSDPCLDAWQGITCLTQNGTKYISGLKVSTMGLVGTLPEDLSLLSSLQSLDLAWNHLSSTLPSALGELTMLSTIDISDNHFTGGIPTELSTLVALTIFDASFNFFSGSISSLPYAWMTALQSLKLNDNALLGSIAPNAFINCTSLLQVNIYKNQISGSLPHIPASVARFSMHENALSGTIPPSFFRGNLEMLDLYINYLTGSLPQSISNAEKLHFLSVDSNLISGSLPQQWNSLTTFQALQAGDNFLSGPVPEELFEQTSLSVFMALKNLLTGSLPRETDRDGGLFDYFNAASNFLTGSLPVKGGEDILMLANNFLTGSIASGFFTVDSTYIDVSNNILSGTIPSGVGAATGLYNLILSQNSFSGTMPEAVYSIPTLAVLAFAENTISGTFPVMNSLTKLNSLIVTDNSMHGTIPSLQAPATLENLGLGHNFFSGCLPSDIVSTRMGFLSFTANAFDCILPSAYTTMSRLQVLDVSDNFISGTMYSDLSNNELLYDVNVHLNLLEGPLPKKYNKNMVELVMSSNAFTGTLSREIASITGLKVLLMQENRLTGSLDDVFTDSNMTELRSIDLSDNAFTGLLPDSLFQLPKIETIALVKNCFRTKVPRSACDSTSIRILALDGLAAGNLCRSALWDPLSLFGDTYFVEHTQHSIPSCIFKMENLTTLHLSGNGLTGNIENIKLDLSSKLSSVSLSHNQLTGTLPQSILNTILNFVEFDISYNRFSGTCSSDNSNEDLNDRRKDGASVLSIEVNRLSGDIPIWMNYFTVVKALSGNMFQCSDQSDLPSHDPDSDVYICGSGELDSALWVLFVACVVGTILAIYVLQVKSFLPRVTLYQWIMNPELAMLRHICHRFQKDVADALTMKFISASMISSAASSSKALFDVRLFNSGNICLVNVCRVILCAVLTVVLPCILLLKFLSGGSERTHSHQYRWLISAAYMSGTVSAAILFVLWAMLVAVSVVMIYRRHSYVRKVVDTNISHASRARATFTLRNKAEYATVVALNTVVVCVVNGVYIYIQLKDVSQGVQIFSQVLLAGFKLIWDTFAVGAAISWMSSHRLDKFDDRSLLFTALLVFNNIIAPCFVTAVTDDACFKGLFESATAVSVTYVNAQCSAYDVDYMEFIPFCSKFGNKMFTTSYVPPFNYNYQCSSAILKSFIPVFVYAYAFMILALPVMDYAICAVVTERVPEIIRRNLAGIMWPNHVTDPSKPLIRVDRIISTLMRHFAVLLTFGFAYPLLGVGVVIAMLQYVWKWRLLVVRFVAVSSILSVNHSSCKERSSSAMRTIDVTRKNQSEFLAEQMKKLNDDCKDAWRGTYVCLWAVIWPGAVFMGCVLFDVVGDELGWRNAIWIFVATLLLPLVYLLTLKLPWMRSLVETDLFANMSGLDETVNPVVDESSAVMNEL